MPTRKQRRRREKSFRHDYEYVFVDDEGNEVVVDEPPAKADAGENAASGKAKAEPARAQRGKGARTARTGRVVQPASWRRVAKRGLIFAPLMFVVVSILDDRLSPAQHAVQTAFLLAFFLPFSYVMDRIAYRMYLKRIGAPPAEEKPARPPASKRQPPTRSPR